jgi:hypothetical protein
MKMTWRRTNKIPTKKEIDLLFRNKTEKEKREGMIEFELAYESTFSKESQHIQNYQQENLMEGIR